MLHDLQCHRFPGLDLLDLCRTDPAQPLTTVGEELDDLNHDMLEA